MSGTVVSIDPGLRYCGVAVFQEKVLVQAGLVKNPEEVKRGPVAWRAMAAEVQGFIAGGGIRTLATEFPKIYPLRQQKGDQADLIEVAGVAGAVVGALFERAGSVVGYEPYQWKGTVPKDIHNKRVLTRLSEAEHALLDDIPAGLVHNTIDAIGIGLVFLKRWMK